MSDTMREHLSKSDWMFSGMKTFHELNEAFPSLLDEQGNRKPFNQFLNDVQKVDNTYNGNWLRSEYNFAQASASMAAKWEDYAGDGDRYLLQYRTAGDGRVRPEHAALDGVTLPASDKFWDTYYPPNGWNCRCTAVQVLREDYRQTPHEEAMDRGAQALAGDTKGMFRFNSGKQESVFPAYNPYTTSKCSKCPRKLNLAAGLPDDQLCQACDYIRSMVKKESVTRLTTKDVADIRVATKKWVNEHLPLITLSNGQITKRLILQCNGKDIVLNQRFFTEAFTKNIKNLKLAKTMELATQIEQWLPSAKLVRKEAGRHHDCDFLVFKAEWKDVGIELKVKDQKEKIAYTMRIKKED